MQRERDAPQALARQGLVRFAAVESIIVVLSLLEPL
jgi:hypothetical protein